ncbi:hypothetical protein LCGC14_0269650 [marine sediment metagenome]|uniref:PEP-CTERM protein-sorting domain-containing protein n=1 Tax=marine sediment metagenome TaxID=412755 RepID=A0A0F9TZI9_9ZZZZ
MKTHLRIAAMLAMAVVLTNGVGTASGYVYGYDPAKAALGGFNSMYMELAQDPTQIVGGIYAGKYEYFFDMYTLANGGGSTFYVLHLVGLDNSKIANAQTIRPDAGVFKTQRWGDRDLWEGPNIYEEWPAATGRLLDFWDEDRNDDLASATAFDVSRTSYDDGSGGWTDSGLGYAGSSTDNPHASGDYVPFSSWPFEIWKAELTGPGQPLHWWNTQVGVTPPAQDTIYIAGGTYWSPPGTPGLTFTLRIVYDEVIDPATIGWSLNTTIDYDILGDFTIPLPPVPGDFDGDRDVDTDDINLLCDNMGDPAYDVDGDDDADEDDMIYLIQNLVELTDGVRVGTKRGDFNLDGFVDGTDLALMKTAFGQPLMDYADGNANCDDFVDGTDLAILKINFGFIADPAVPEPVTIGLLALGGLAMLRRRKS